MPRVVAQASLVTELCHPVSRLKSEEVDWRQLEAPSSVRLTLTSYVEQPGITAQLRCALALHKKVSWRHRIKQSRETTKSETNETA